MTTRPPLLPFSSSSLPLITLLVIGSMVSACAEGDGPPTSPGEHATLALEFVSVVPMDGERVLPDMTVLIGDGRVVAMGPADDVAVPEGALRVNGRGRFLIPGLNDMHVHFQEEHALGRFIATGVTGVRVLWGGQSTLDLRDGIARGELTGPDIYTAGTIIEGPPPPELAAVIDTAGRVIVRDSTDGARAVREQHAAGYDFIKVYNNVPASAYGGIVAEARSLGIPVAGHVPFEVGLDGALAAGQASIEHLRGYIGPLVPADAARQPGADLRSRTLAWADGDLSRIRELAQRTRDAGVWSVPTLAVRMILKPDRLVEAYLATEEASHMTEGMRAFYTERMSIPWMSNFTPEDFEGAMDGFAVADSLIRALVGVGAPLMAGTDTPPLGYALHRELEELVGAGLSPYQALEAATVNPAVFLARGPGAGMVVEGSPADLVLLDGNPLEDIGNTRRIAGVIRRGGWLDRAALDVMLGEGS
ncbi:MAG: amidohydrolase family protein [Gemmatimonadetes bacterium]|nr:amidohydrolase family protein [Gemmatimonadota bacterium]